MPEKRLTLNSEKRKTIADVFQNHFEQNSPKKKLHTKAIVDYNEARTKMKVLANTVVRHHQPQEDVDTIKSMIAKYNSSGGELYKKKNKSFLKTKLDVFFINNFFWVSIIVG